MIGLLVVIAWAIGEYADLFEGKRLPERAR